jgi:uncharacterized membrane protein
MIKGSIVVDRPIAAVFDYASHFEKHPEWQPELKAATFAGPLSVGAVGTETRKMGPQTSTYEFRVSECMPPQRIGFETTSGSMRPIGTMLFNLRVGSQHPRRFRNVDEPSWASEGDGAAHRTTSTEANA